MMTHTILLLNSPAQHASLLPVPGFRDSEWPVLRQRGDRREGDGNSPRRRSV
jgi:hypothetical protein